MSVAVLHLRHANVQIGMTVCIRRLWVKVLVQYSCDLQKIIFKKMFLFGEGGFYLGAA